MRLRGRLTMYYSIAFSVVMGITLLAIYLLSAEYRKDEFYRRLEDRTITTFKLLVDVEQIDQELLKLFDENTINSLYDEKIILFDSTGSIIYSSIADNKITYSKEILNELKKDHIREVKRNEGSFEIVGLNFKEKGETYYGIAKAFDRYGRSKLQFLGWVLVFTFIGSVVVVILLSFFVSRAITVPVKLLAQEVEGISPQHLEVRINEPKTKDEINFLARKFNDMLTRVEQAFRFQKHFTQHLSHELKTPLAVLVSNVERAQNEKEPEKLLQTLDFQKEGLMEVSNIIDALLDISKTEASNESITTSLLRMDEMLFECVENINNQYGLSKFNLTISPDITEETDLQVRGSSRMLKIALTNLLKNAVQYANTSPVEVFITKKGKHLFIEITNDGKLILPEETPFLFTHFFRGSNAAGINGFGLGLVLVNKIIQLHNGSIVYSDKEGKNSFSLTLLVSA